MLLQASLRDERSGNTQPVINKNSVTVMFLHFVFDLPREGQRKNKVLKRETHGLQPTGETEDNSWKEGKAELPL